LEEFLPRTITNQTNRRDIELVSEFHLAEAQKRGERWFSYQKLRVPPWFFILML